jgi:hypothetical protein
MTAASPASWERHLFWGLPALALALVVAGLVWWGQEPSAPPFLPEPGPLFLPTATAQSPEPGRRRGAAPADAAEARSPERRDIPAAAPPPPDRGQGR